MSEPSCATCKYKRDAHRSTNSNPFAICVRYPPTQTAPFKPPHFPEVASRLWCGEYQPKETNQ